MNSTFKELVLAAILFSATVLTLILVSNAGAAEARENAVLTSVNETDEEITAPSNEIELKGIFDCPTEGYADEQETSEEETAHNALEGEGICLLVSPNEQDDNGEVETEIPCGNSVRSVATKRIGIAGDLLREDIYDYLAERLAEAGIVDWLPYALCQAHQESGFNPNAENKNGLDKGLFQYRITYWDYSRGDIFDWRAQIDRYVEQVANRLKSGLSIEETISRHYTSDYVTEVNEKYVADVLRWYGRIEEEMK